MSDEALLAEINKKLAVLVAFAVDEQIRMRSDGKQRQRSIDRVLRDAGLDVKDIALLLGKSRQAVDQMLAKDKVSKA